MMDRSAQKQLLTAVLASPAGYHNLMLYIQNDLAEDATEFNAAANKSVFAADNLSARLEAARRYGRVEARQDILKELQELTRGNYYGG